MGFWNLSRLSLRAPDNSALMDTEKQAVQGNVQAHGSEIDNGDPPPPYKIQADVSSLSAAASDCSSDFYELVKQASQIALAGQCCFICFDDQERGQHAVPVFVRRPSNPHAASPGYLAHSPATQGDHSTDDDATVWRKLKDVCYHREGMWWKRWLPYYGIEEIEEVRFRFTGRVEQDGEYSVNFKSVSIDTLQEELDSIVALDQNSAETESGNNACWEDVHSDECRVMMESEKPCIVEQVQSAKQRKKKLASLHRLRDCARNPRIANGLGTLEGMAQESCILELDKICVTKMNQRSECTDDELPGLRFIVGWQRDRFNRDKGLLFAMLWVVILCIWGFVVVRAHDAHRLSSGVAVLNLVAAFFMTAGFYLLTAMTQ